MSLPKFFRKETFQQQIRPRLEPSELLVLKELAGFILSEDFPGSQLEAFLHARASPPESESDENAPILTPLSASKSEADTAQTMQPPIPSQTGGATKSTTSQPSPSKSVPTPEAAGSGGTKPPSTSSTFTHPSILVDHSLQNCEFGSGTTANSHSFNRNVGCFNNSTSVIDYRYH